MRLGCFGKFNQFELIEKNGFDCAELDFGELAAMTDAQLSEVKRQIRNSVVSAEVFSGLLPLNLRLYDEAFDETYWLKYIDNGASKACELGCRMIPFGAGKCRSIPTAARKIDCRKKLVSFVQNICTVLNNYHIDLVIEPLGPHYSNYINTIEEANEFAEDVNAGNCKIMCDYRHMISADDPLDNIIKYKDKIQHAHIDYPFGIKRKFPQLEDGADYSVYMMKLNQAGYNGILTIEAIDFENFDAESAKSCLYLKKMMQNE